MSTNEHDWMPTIGGSMTAYKPQWKHRGEFGPTINKRILKMEGGDKWTDVPFEIIRGGVAITVDGQVVTVGIPFPHMMPGVLETIHLCGREQAMALAWNFAAWAASVGGEIEVRAEGYELKYDIKARVLELKAL